MQLLLPETSTGSDIGKRVQNQILSLETPGAGQKIVKADEGNRCQGKMAENISRGQKHSRPYPLRHVPQLVAFHATDFSFHLFSFLSPCVPTCVCELRVLFATSERQTFVAPIIV